MKATRTFFTAGHTYRKVVVDNKRRSKCSDENERAEYAHFSARYGHLVSHAHAQRLHGKKHTCVVLISEKNVARSSNGKTAPRDALPR